jgi:hypothetical protein
MLDDVMKASLSEFARLFRDLRGEIRAELAAIRAEMTATGSPRGLYDRLTPYRKGDSVAHNGGLWMAKCDGPGPLPGPDWMLAAQQGKPGKPGTSLRRGHVEGGRLVLEMSDGSSISIDLKERGK